MATGRAMVDRLPLPVPQPRAGVLRAGDLIARYRVERLMGVHTLILEVPTAEVFANGEHVLDLVMGLLGGLNAAARWMVRGAIGMRLRAGPPEATESHGTGPVAVTLGPESTVVRITGLSESQIDQYLVPYR